MNEANNFPSEAHKHFQPFAGEFAAEVKLWFGPGDPHVSKGTMTNTMELNHQFLHQVYEGDEVEGPFPSFRGRGYRGFNTASKQYEGFWVDTASTMMMNESGAADAAGKVWTMTGAFNGPQNGELMKKKSVITLIDNNHHKMEQFIQGPDGKEFKTMEINYSRK